jgi:hypothetical protein
MTYQITYEPLLPMEGIAPTTIERETAAEAWAAVLVLTANSKKTMIIDPDGKKISQQKLHARANKEAN